MKVGGRPKAREGSVTPAKSTNSQGTSINAGVSPGLGHATPHPPAREAGEHQLDQWDRGLSGWTEPCVPGEEAKTLKMPRRLHLLQMETKPLSNIVPTKGEKVEERDFCSQEGKPPMTGNDCEHEMPGRIFNPYSTDTSKGLK